MVTAKIQKLGDAPPKIQNLKRPVAQRKGVTASMTPQVTPTKKGAELAVIMLIQRDLLCLISCMGRICVTVLSFWPNSTSLCSK